MNQKQQGLGEDRRYIAMVALGLFFFTLKYLKAFLNFILERYEKDGVKEMGSDKLSSLIKLSGLDRNELKEAFEGAANIREGYFGLQRQSLPVPKRMDGGGAFRFSNVRAEAEPSDST
jgi:hypothetical protein